MARINTPQYSFNRGEVANTALARVDIERMRLSADIQVNWQPLVLGPMMLRPGTQYLGATKNQAASALLPFVFANNDSALLELTDSVMRIWNVDVSADTETLVTRPTVTTTVTDGDFSGSSGWTLTTTGTGAIATITSGGLHLRSPAVGGLAQGKSTVTIAGGDQNVVHGFRIDVDYGPVTFRAGSTDGEDDYIEETVLETGIHSLSFTPTGGSVYIQFETTTAPNKVVNGITIDAAGTLEIPTPWLAADLGNVRYAQSGDVVFVACDGYQQYRIERRNTTSWSAVLYKSDDGPLRVANLTDTTLTPSALKGNVTITPSRPVFYSDHVGAVFRLFSSGQTVEDSLASVSSHSDPIRVTGVGDARVFRFTISGTWVGTVRLQRSLESEDSGFTDVGSTFTTNTTDTYDDTYDNLIAWYRFIFRERTSGTAEVSLVYTAGGGAGYVRVQSLSKPELAINGAMAADTDWTKGTGWTIAAGVASSDGTQAADSDLVNIFDSDIAVNGTFTTDSDWTKGTGWTIAAGVATCDGSQNPATSQLAQANTGIIAGSSYVVAFTLSGWTAGTVTPIIGGTSGTARGANGTYTETIVAGGSGATIVFQASATFAGNIDTVTVGTYNNSSILAGAAYTVAFTVSGYTAGNVSAVLGGGTAGTSRAANGTFTEILYAGATGAITVRADLDFIGSIDNVSVKAVADVASVEVLSTLSSLTPTSDWAEGDWSDKRGWPSAVAFFDGRLWWAGRDRIWGSISDNYSSFDIDYEGDSGPINRSVGFGPVDTINWLLPLARLIVGRQGAETSVRSGSLDEPLTPTNFTLKDCSTQGSFNIAAAKVDTRGVFIQQSNRRVYSLGLSSEAQDYVAHDLTRLNPDIGVPGFEYLAVQRQPDTQLHFVLSDGVVANLVSDPEDAVECWWKFDTADVQSTVESVCVLPGTLEDRVYYIVKRIIGGVTKRYLERVARRDQCDGLPEARLSDSHIIYTGGTTTVTGLSHLAAREVVAWGWDDDGTTGNDCGTGLNTASSLTITKLTVSGGGTVTIPTAYDNVCVGLPYIARFKSAKLAYAAQMGTALNQTKKIDRIGLILANTHHQGVRFGQDFTTMDDLPLVKDGAAVTADTVHDEYDGVMTTLNGSWNTDSRLCLVACSPRPAMVMSAVLNITTNETP